MTFYQKRQKYGTVAKIKKQWDAGKIPFNFGATMLAQLPNGDWLEADIVHGVSVQEDPRNGWLVNATDDCECVLMSEYFEKESAARDFALVTAISINASKTREPDVEAIIRDAVKAAVEAFLNAPAKTQSLQFGDWRQAV